MTQILNSEVQARLELSKVESDFYHLSVRKGKEATILVITEAEATTLANHLHLLIQND